MINTNKNYKSIYFGYLLISNKDCGYTCYNLILSKIILNIYIYIYIYMYICVEFNSELKLKCQRNCSPSI